MRQKKVYIQTFGCQMNVYDSERLLQVLARRGYIPVERPDEADLIFVNTCSVREKPEKKVYSALGRFRALKTHKPGLIIGVGGCVAQQEGKRILAKVPFVDFLLGTKELSRLDELLDGVERMGRRGVATSLDGRVDPYKPLPLSPAGGKSTAFVSIMQGCDNFCSFCIVPFVRGREVSRASADVLGEIRLLSDTGVREVTLLGQNVNSYGNKAIGELNFVGLLEAIQEIQGIDRIRFITSHPKDLSLPLIRSFKRMPKLCEHIHLPLQSGSNAVLRAMNRGYTVEEYLEKIGRLREACPDISITTDIIVGFPGEGEEDYRATREAMEEIRFDELFSFVYSDRPHTRAALLENKVDAEAGRRRLMELQKRQREITAEKNHAWEGREVEVLAEDFSKGDSKELTGRTRNNHVVNFPGEPSQIGSLVHLRISRAFAHSLRGEPI